MYSARKVSSWCAHGMGTQIEEVFPSWLISQPLNSITKRLVEKKKNKKEKKTNKKNMV
jgi:hypothetical protein